MAGVVVPTATVFLVAMLVFGLFSRIPPATERAMIFPMAVNPFMWGVWNVLYVRVNRAFPVSIGWYGAGLAMLLVAAGVLLAKHLQVFVITPTRALAVLPPTMAAYYFLWKYVVRFLNNLLGVSE